MKPSFYISILLLTLFTICAPDSSEAGSSEKQTEQVHKAAEVTATGVSGSPELFLPEHDYRFDTVPAGQAVNHDFTIENRGTALLRITRVKTG